MCHVLLHALKSLMHLALCCQAVASEATERGLMAAVMDIDISPRMDVTTTRGFVCHGRLKLQILHKLCDVVLPYSRHMRTRCVPMLAWGTLLALRKVVQGGLVMAGPPCLLTQVLARVDISLCWVCACASFGVL